MTKEKFNDRDTFKIPLFDNNSSVIFVDTNDLGFKDYKDIYEEGRRFIRLLKIKAYSTFFDGMRDEMENYKGKEARMAYPKYVYCPKCQNEMKLQIYYNPKPSEYICPECECKLLATTVREFCKYED